MTTFADRVRAAGARVLTIDIERLPGMVPIFDQKTRGFIPVSQWTRLPSLLCFAARWYGQKRTHFHATWNGHDDMVAAAWDLYEQADVVVTYNGIRFDNKHLASEWVTAGLPPPSPWKDVDLYSVNRSAFGFESKSLVHLARMLDIGISKVGRYDPAQAEACVNGDRAAQRLMRSYNVGDVDLTEAVYDRLRGYMPRHPHLGVNRTDAVRTCNQCRSTDLARNGTRLAEVIVFELFRCNDCGANVTGTRHARAAVTRGIR